MERCKFYGQYQKEFFRSQLSKYGNEDLTTSIRPIVIKTRRKLRKKENIRIQI